MTAPDRIYRADIRHGRLAYQDDPPTEGQDFWIWHEYIRADLVSDLLDALPAIMQADATPPTDAHPDAICDAVINEYNAALQKLIDYAVQAGGDPEHIREASFDFYLDVVQALVPPSAGCHPTDQDGRE